MGDTIEARDDIAEARVGPFNGSRAKRLRGERGATRVKVVGREEEQKGGDAGLRAGLGVRVIKHQI